MRNNTDKMSISIRLKCTLSLLLAVFGLCSGMYGQGTGGMSIPAGLPDVVPPSPTVAALMKFEEVPVNNYNGMPDINIPIYSAKANGGIGIDVKLGYHPSNINANLAASDCGLGWSLFAGGSISRTVKGLPDEIKIPGNKLGIHWNEYHSGGVINPFYKVSGWMDQGIHFSSSNQLTTFNYMYDAMIGGAGSLDTEHDLYQYNFMGYSGRFILQMNGSVPEVVKLDKNPLKIVNFYDATSLVPNYFEITDDKGVKYRFDVVETTSTSTFTHSIKPYSGGLNPTPGETSNSVAGFTYRSAFHLSKVYDSANILAVDLSYTNDGKKEIVASNSTTYAKATSIEMSTLVNNLDSQGLLGEFNPLPSSLSITSTQSTLVRKLSEIQIIGQAKVSFMYTTDRPDTNISTASDTYKLSRVTVLNWNSQQQRRFDFAYGSSTKLDTRMLLSSVKAYDKAGVFEYDYQLSYKDTYPVPGLIGKDSWGYINQKPAHQAIGLYKETTPEHCTNDALEIMKIPTGGAIKYNYEGNTYSYIGSEAVTNFDGNPDNWVQEQTSTMVFTTISNNMTTLFELGGAGQHEVYFKATSNFIGTSIDWRFRIWRLVNGSYMDAGTLYNQTDEILTLPSGVYKVSFDTPGVTQHSGTIYANITAYYKRRPLGTIPNPYQEKKYLYGGGIRIKNVQYYKDLSDASNSSIVPEKQTNYNYSFFTDNLRSSGSLVYPKPLFKYTKQKRECMRFYSGVFVVNSSDNLIIDYDITTTTDNLAVIKTKGSEVGYQNVTVTETGNGRREMVYTSAIDFPETVTTFNTQYPFLPTENIDYKRGNLISSKIYDQQSRVLDETVNTYDYVTDSGTINTGIRFYYPGDYQFVNYFNHQSYNAYVNYLASCTTTSTCFCVEGQPNTFITFARTKESFGTANLVSALSKQYFYTGSSTTALSPVQNTSTYTYDPYNKQIKKQEVTNSLGEVTLTEYFYAKNLLSESNATAMSNKNMISLPLKIVTTQDGSKVGEQKIVYKDWGNNLIAPEVIQSSKGTDALENRVVYNRMDNTTGNPLEVQQEGGMKICYIWGYNKTVPVAKIENMAYASIPAELITAIETASNASVTGLESSLVTALENLRNASELAGAFVTTMTYVPQVGAKVVTDPKGKKTTYDYDNSGRLKGVWDHEGKILSEHQYRYRTQN